MQYLSKNVRSIYSRLGTRNSTTHALVSKITWRIKLTFDAQNPLTPQTIHIDPTKLSGFEWNEETHLLAENLSDCKFFEHLVSFYKRKHNIRFSTCWYPLQGGGDTIASVYDYEIELKQHLCLAVLDSDKKYPDCGVGDTAKKLKVCHHKKKPIHCMHYVMENVREVENLIPFSALRTLDDLSSYQVFTELSDLDYSYFDMKKGLETYKTNSEVKNYWSRLLVPHKRLKECYNQCFSCATTSIPKPKSQDCLEVCGRKCIIEGFGSRILDKALNDLHSVLADVKSSDLTPGQLAEWEAIGGIVFEWCCSPIKLRV